MEEYRLVFLSQFLGNEKPNSPSYRVRPAQSHLPAAAKRCALLDI